MKLIDDPFLPLADSNSPNELSALLDRPAAPQTHAAQTPKAAAGQISVGVLQGFDLLENALVAQCASAPGQVRCARTTVALSQAGIGRSVVVLEADDGPVVIGVIEDPLHRAALPLVAQADGERQVIQAEREIVLRCGEASITLTRAGKVIIKGNYILSRSAGYNKIKGAAIDIN